MTAVARVTRMIPRPYCNVVDPSGGFDQRRHQNRPRLDHSTFCILSIPSPPSGKRFDKSVFPARQSSALPFPCCLTAKGNKKKLEGKTICRSSSGGPSGRQNPRWVAPLILQDQPIGMTGLADSVKAPQFIANQWLAKPYGF